MSEPKTVHLGVMALERRCVPAVYVVTNTSDTDPGSLRQAIASANVNPGPDDLQFSGLFDSPQTIKLTSGELAINGPLTITGPGSSQLTVDANQNGRAFNIQPGDGVTMLFSGFTVANGLVATGTVGGGAMSFRANGSTLALEDCAVINSKANFLPGGALLLRPTITTGATNTLTIQNCAFTENHNGGGNTSGGAISALKCNVSVAKSSFTQNLGGRGAAMGVFDSSLSVETSTFSVNTAPAGGGAIDFSSTVINTPMTIRNCTFSGNTSIDGPGTAIYHSRSGPTGSLTVTSSTVVNNSTTINLPFYAVHNQGSGSLVLESTIVTGNRDQGGNARDIRSLSTVTANYCAIGSPTGFSMTGNGNLAFGLDLLLGPLVDNGGPTLTHAFPSNSPAVDTGLSVPGILTDQRGFDRNIGQGVDIGAFELQLPPRVVDVIFNDGAIQRSRVTKLEVVFAGPPVTFPGGLNGAFQLNRVGPTGQTGDVELSATQSGNRVVLQFLASGTVPLDPGNSLIDGLYQMIVVANGVSAEGGLLDGNNDGAGGDNFETPTMANAPFRIFRLFGDINGDGSVAASDFLVFRQSFGGVNASLDFDNDGAVAASDFIQFRLRFGGGI